MMRFVSFGSAVRAVVIAAVVLALAACSGGDGSKNVTIANAGAAQLVHGGVPVALSGGGTPASNTSITSYTWTQIAGPAVVLTGATTTAPTFTAPTVALLTTLTFRLTVTDSMGGSGSASVNVNVQSQHNVVLNWNANRETAVNGAGGGYLIQISGQTQFAVPYVSGPTAPTTTTVALWSGSYTATITAFSPLTPPGGAGGSTSAVSAPITINVP